MKRLFVLLLAFVLMFSMVGCSKPKDETVGVEQDQGNDSQSNDSQNNKNEKSNDKEEITLRFSWWGGDPRHEATLAMIEAFEKKYPHINIEPEYAGWQGFYDKQATQMIGGTEADIMQINYNWAYIFSPDGEGFYDLKTIDTINLDNWDQSTLDPFTINGKLQAVPASVGGRMFFLNKTTYEKAGVELPTTWEELMEAGRTFKEVLGDDYFALGALDNDDEATLVMFMYLAQKYGKNVIEDNKLAYTEEEITEGFRFLKDLLDSHVLADAYYDAAERNQENPHWINGEYAGNVQWNSSIGKFVSTLDPNLNQEIVIAPEPFFGMEGQVHSGSFNKVSMGFAVSKNTEYPEEAAMFINYMFTDPEAIEILGLQRAVPVNKVAFETLEDLGMLEGLQYEGHVVIQNTEGFSFHPYYEDAILREAYNEPVMEFMYGDLTTPEEAAKKFVEAFNPALEEAMNK